MSVAAVCSRSGGAGTLGNSGTIRILAGAGVPADGIRYSPISAGAWGGTGTYQAIGGTWNATSHTFTASSVTSGASGSAVALDLASVQRALIDDNGPAGRAGRSARVFWRREPPEHHLHRHGHEQHDADALKSLLPTDESVLSGWTSRSTNYTVSPTNPVYLSFNVGAGHSADELDLW